MQDVTVIENYEQIYYVTGEIMKNTKLGKFGAKTGIFFPNTPIS